MGLRPEEKDDSALETPFKRTRAQLAFAILTIALNCIILFCGGVTLLAMGAFGMANLLGVDPGVPSLEPARVNSTRARAVPSV